MVISDLLPIDDLGIVEHEHPVVEVSSVARVMERVRNQVKEPCLARCDLFLSKLLD